MAYNGYLIKAGHYTIPNGMIAAETYKITKNGQDLNSYRDADGDLHRTAIPNFMWKVEFETKPLLTNVEMTDLLKNIQRNYINAVEKNLTVTAYSPEDDFYFVQEMYMPDIAFEIYYADEQIIKYNPIRIAFIGSKKAVIK